MNAFVFLLATCEVAAYQFENINVGTVLFSPSDISKKRWSATEIGLLRARRHFQTLIPPPDMINTNEDFTNALLGYFKDSYSSIKSKAKDPEADSIMNAALSDALGGYLKAWVLPVTKFAYYGGTVSQEDAFKLFQLYDEIKQSLDTDGRTWRSPNSNLLNSVSINVASLRSPITRNIVDPCDSLAYFEKSDTGISIPVPNVNWNTDSASIFVPLKNQSLIPLESSYNESLIKYYDAAMKCIEKSKLEDQVQFENKFQSWLTKEVLPHLNDEKFYPALGSVLSLVNRTRNLVDTVIDLYAEAPLPSTNRTTIIGIPVDLSSNKLKFISVIIILEVAWCIPTLCFVLCRKIRRNKSKSVYVYVERKKGKQNLKESLCKSESTQLNRCQCVFEDTGKIDEKKNKHEVQTQSTIQQDTDLMCQRVSRSCNIEARHSIISCKPSSGAGTRSNIFQMCSEVDKVHERQIRLRHGSLKKTSVNDADAQKSSTSGEVYSCVPDKNSLNVANSLTVTPELEPTKTVTLLKENNKIHELIMTEIKKHDEETQKNEQTNSAGKDSREQDCKCSHSKDCTKQTKSTVKAVKNAQVPTVQLAKADTKKAQLKYQKIVKDTKSRGLKLTTGNPYLEITLDRPQRKMSVDISQTQAVPRRSKIPQRAFSSRDAQTINVVSKAIQSPFSKRRSFIPQPKRQNTDDDIIIENKKTSTGNNTLNITL